VRTSINPERFMENKTRLLKPTIELFVAII